MTDDLTIRKGCPADGGPIAGFNAAMAAETEGIRLDPAVAQAGVAGLFARPERGFYVIAESDGEVVGSLMVTPEWSDWRAGTFWWIQSVYIRPAHRRRGVYRRLHAWVVEKASVEPDVCGVRLYVIRENEAAQETYRAQGMHETDYRLYEQPIDPTT